ncbi:MAG: trehalase family glycosidase [Candidatus Saccharimonadales bacterium]
MEELVSEKAISQDDKQPSDVLEKSVPIDIYEEACTILRDNDQGTYTIPAAGLYPHQWLWDSCFIAVGQRHYDVDRAKQEILSLLRGQWSNGMLPHMIFNQDPAYRRDRTIWQSWRSPYSPDDIATSGITQPPIIAEAVIQIGKKLPLTERRQWYRQVLPALIAHHEWLYRDRDPHGEGLVLQVHPWECGLDNTPPWIAELNQHQLPWWIRLINKVRLGWIINIFRRDTHFVPANQRLSSIEALAFFHIQHRLRRKAYDTSNSLSHSIFDIEDLTFNSILIRANQHLKTIARSLRYDLPENLLKQMDKTEQALQGLWDPYSSQYYSRNFVTHKLLKEPSIAALMPLYAGCLTEDRARTLVKMLENVHLYGPTYPVPSVPVNSSWFNPTNYWQGPTWVNMNWLIIDGLERNGFSEHAAALRESTIEMVQRAGCYEYFNPEDGEAAGAANFSWTAALVIDLIEQTKK